MSRTVGISREQPILPRKRNPASSTDRLAPARKLLKDIIDAGGVLERDVRKDRANYRTLVGHINGRQMAPDGQQVIMIEHIKPFHIKLRLSSVSQWKTEAPAVIASAQRNPQWHPVVSALRKEDGLSSIDASLRQRAFRLLHTLAREAEARDHKVLLPPKRQHRGDSAEPGDLAGCLIINVEQISCSLTIRQVHDRVPHSVAPRTDPEESKRDSSRFRIGSPGPVASQRLAITLDTSSRYSSKMSWSDTKTRPLESRLPDVLTTSENWAVIDAECTEADRRAQIDAQKRREREDALAREAYTQQVLADQLNTELQSWEFVGRLRSYLEAMPARIEHLADDDQRSAAIEWLEWCERYTTERDPFHKPIRMPRVKPPSYSDIAQFRKHLGFGANLGSWPT